MPLGESLGSSVDRVGQFNDKAGVRLYYIVSLKPAGFVIVAADNRIEPIIGFASRGKYEASDGNPLGTLVSQDLAARVGYVRSAAGASDTNTLAALSKWQQLCTTNGEPVISPNRLTTISDVRVAPLTQTTWSQTTAADAGNVACYNYYTPPYGDGNKNNYPAGCVATAMAQLMRYYQLPAAGVGTAPFDINVNGSSQTYYLHGGDTFGGPYVWSDMPLMPAANAGTSQCQAIGALVADAGATVNMSYSSGGSSGDMLKVKDALVTTFQYSSAIKGYDGSSGLGAGLLGMINPNLDARYPVLLSISGPGGGHAVVVDGYGYNSGTLYHHLNLGWSGVDTAWYALPIVDTSAYYFNVLNGCIYNVYTNGSGEIISGRVVDQIGRPVANATVTALRNGGGTYTAMTDAKGIYALAQLPSSSSYAVRVVRDGYSSATNTFWTALSADWGGGSGNFWGADFTWNMSPAAIDHFSWSNLGATQNINAPFAVTVTARNLTNGVATGFTGSANLSAYATAFGSPSVILGNISWNYSVSSGSDWTHGYAFTPGTNLQVTAVRAMRADKISIWTDSGTLLASQFITASGSWTEAALTTPILLAAGSTYRIGAHIPAMTLSYYQSWTWPGTFPDGTVGQTFYYSYGDLFPNTVYGTAEGPLVDLRYRVVTSTAIPITPTASGAFISGAWNGSVSLGATATNVVLKADDAAGHVATSNPFSVVDPNAMPPLITANPQSRTNGIGENATFTVSASGSGALSYFWRRNGSSISGANASSYTLNNVQLSDSGAQFGCVVSNSYGSVTSQTAILTVICTNVVVAPCPAITLNAGGLVYAVAPLPDGSIILGGYFNTVNGVSRSRLARLLPSGTVDPVWNPAPNASVLALAVSGTNLYVGGAFTSIGTYSRNYIARLATTGTGVADPTWDPNAEYYVETLLVNGADVYAGGDFFSIGGQNRSCIAKLSASGTGAADPTWNPYATISGDYPAVYALALSGGSIYAGGYFTSIGGQTRYGIAKLSMSGTGAADASWNPSANGSVSAIVPSGNYVYAGGSFSFIGGQNRSYIARLSNSGTGLADAWNPSADSGVWSLLVNGQCVYAGGSFTNVGGLHRLGLAKLTTVGAGSADSGWVADCNGEVNALVSTSSALYLGGAFTQVAGQSRAGIAALTYAIPQLLSPQTTVAGQFQFTLSGERGQSFDILTSSNLVNWDSLATLTNTAGTTNFVDTATGPGKRFYRSRQVP